MRKTMDGKTAIITSAAHDVGRAIAQRFLDNGASVMLADYDEKRLESTSDQFDDPDGRLARFHYVSQDKLSITNLIAATVDRFDRIDILVNSAQSINAPGAFLDLSPAQFDEAFGDTVRDVFQLTQAVVRKMIANRAEGSRSAGNVVNISSIAAVRTVPELLTFSVSCAALDQLTRSMAASLAPEGIRVNSVALGGVMTERLLNAFREHEALRDEMVRVTPLGRLAEMEEAAEAVLYLASDAASYVTGQVLAVDGGRTLLDPLASPIR